jgi:hypothetical protein
MIKIIKIIELLLHKYINYDMVNIYQYIKLNTFAKEGAMHTEVHNAVMAADQGTQYDESAKRLLGQKSILAQILVRTVDEFKGMNPRYVETLIEGEPYISRIPLEPGLTNQEAMRAKSGQRITGLNTENQEHAEGLVRFDIVFYVRMKDGLSQIIINVEAQKDEPQRYGILNRAVFYVSRLISSQKERDFENTEYDDIKRVYSIWVCMNMEENSLSHIHLVKDDLVGYHDWRGKLDLFNIVMIGLAKELPGQGEQYELHRLLGALFAEGLTAGERLNIIKEEYDIPIEQTIEQEVDVMCNLSQGIKEAGIAEGREEGRVEGREEGREEGRVEGRSEGRAEEIIETGYEFGLSEQDILERLQKKLSISLQKAQEYLLMFGKQTV